MYPQVIAEASSNIDLTFPASMDAQTSPIDPTPRTNNAAIRVPDRLHRHTIQTFREIKTNNREVKIDCNLPADHVNNRFFLVYICSCIKIINVVAVEITHHMNVLFIANM
ncbi:hypothetical protein HanPSC8_Chr10g0428961 [Helianthus annuus]|nr:hypothetical protein HanPSC8_Chr10g0428961 [Helianthus annuus]